MQKVGKNAISTAIRPRHGRRLAALIACAVAAILSFALVDTAPAAPESLAVQPSDLGVARRIAGSLRSLAAADTALPSYTVSASDAAALTRLGSLMRPDWRVALTPGQGSWRWRTSHRLPLGLWLNGSALVTQVDGRRPIVRITIGAIPLGERLSRLLLRAGMAVMRQRGLDVAPLAERLQGATFTPNSATVALRLGSVADMAALVGSIQPGAVDTARIAELLCALAAYDHAPGILTFSAEVRRLFALQADDLGAAANRARYIALAIRLIGPEAAVLAGSGNERLRRCAATPAIALLHNRADLSKHWALSAAIAARSGAAMSETAGIWKEISDSLPGGSGFSAVDIAADRAGYRSAMRALDTGSAATEARRLQSATQETLMPVMLTTGAEGMSEQDFARQYRDTASPEFSALLAAIDRELAARGM